MKRTFLFLAISLLMAVFSSAQNGGSTMMTGTQTQQAEGQKIFHSSGNQGTPLVGWAQSGASAAVFTQDSFFDQSGVVIQRTGTDGDSTITPTLLVQAGKETAWDQPVIKAGGCLALSGDNWMILYGDSAMYVPGGFLDASRLLAGKLSIDPSHRQLLGADGVTPRASWSGDTFTAPHLTVTGTLVLGNGITIIGQIPAANISGISTVGKTGQYVDLLGRPSIPTDTAQLSNGAGFITSSGTAATISGPLVISKLSGFPNDATKFLSGDGTWKAVPPATASAAPSSPTPGQTYLNTVDHHFYGWNGSAWKQLDN